MPILLFDGPERAHLLPFTYVRPVAHLLLGIDRLIDKWEAAVGEECSVYAESYLQNKFPPVFGKLNRFVNSSFLPSLPLKDQILSLKVHLQQRSKPNQALKALLVLLLDLSKNIFYNLEN